VKFIIYCKPSVLSYFLLCHYVDVHFGNW